MNKTLVNGLKQLGFADKHIRLYIACLELGAASLPEISKRARLQRSTAYLLVADLAKEELMLENHQSYRKLYVAAEPTVILRKLEARHRQLGRINLAFKDALPDIMAAHQTTSTRPRVRTFEGQAGLLAIWKDILQERQEVLLWTNQASEQQIFDTKAHQQFIIERIAKQIPMRVLAVSNPRAQTLIATDQNTLRQTKILPLESSFTSETYVYGDKVAVLDVGSVVFGVITENAQIAASQRAIFELAWANHASN
jgi:sugar-specific transcriptional regulator TrmB